jgi:hypothetical protein
MNELNEFISNGYEMTTITQKFSYNEHNLKKV